MYDRVHFVGIGGIGMLALAQYLIDTGTHVSGSDLHDSQTLDNLRQLGATVAVGHRAANVSNPDLVVVTSAAGLGNPEVLEAHRKGIPVLKRSQLLGQLTDSHRCIAVAGTAGKSTTTALIAHLLRSTGSNTSVFGGALWRDADGTRQGPAIVGSHTEFVVEADEYDRSFLELQPTLALVLNVDFDHPDCYRDMDDMLDAYRRFLHRTNERIIIGGDADTLLATPVDGTITKETYGIGGVRDWRAEEITLGAEGTTFRLVHGPDIEEFHLNLPGQHNVMNAVAAVAAASTFSGRSPTCFRDALGSFRGLVRRLELRGRVGDISLIDDYAHHPTKIDAAIDALSSRTGRLRLVFQPHTFSRTAALLDEFVDALARADEVILVDIYGAREAPLPGVSSRLIHDRLVLKGVRSQYFDDHEAAIEYVSGSAQDGDQIVTMGAGDVTKLVEPILAKLQEKSDTSSKRVMHQPSDVGLKTRAGHGRANANRGALLEALFEGGLTRIREDEPMSRHTSWRVGGPADVFAVATTPESLRRAFEIADSFGVPALVIGGGSNILVADAGIEGVVIANRIRELKVDSLDSHTRIEAGSGVFFARLANFAADEGFTGLEWGVAIPGTVGAGVVNNAGAHFGDVARSLVEVEVIDRHGKHMWKPEQLGFRYRESVLKSNDGMPVTQTAAAVSRCWFTVEPDVARRSHRLIAELMDHRHETQPIAEPSGGSTFANPSGFSAGKLIEDAGLKGIRCGGASFSEKHANFIVSEGSAQASDILSLIRMAERIVHDRFGVVLHPEVQLVGRWERSEKVNMAGVS